MIFWTVWGMQSVQSGIIWHCTNMVSEYFDELCNIADTVWWSFSTILKLQVSLMVLTLNMFPWFLLVSFSCAKLGRLYYLYLHACLVAFHTLHDSCLNWVHFYNLIFLIRLFWGHWVLTTIKQKCYLFIHKMLFIIITCIRKTKT